MAASTAAEMAQQEQIKASREAAAFFQPLDKSTLYATVPQREAGWLLGEKTHDTMEDLSPHVPISDFSLPSGEDQPYVLFVPKENSTSLRLAELSRVLWEMAVGVYVFNSVPSISLQPNHDGSSSCVVPAAYRDGLVGTALFEVDYFIKSLLHGTTIPQPRQREEISASWRKMPHGSVRQSYRDLGMAYMIDDPELGHELYEPKKTPFVRHPPKFVDSELAQSELTPRLTTGQEFEQQAAHISRDVFLRYLDNVGIGLVFGQRKVWQDGGLFVLDPTVHVTSTVSGMTDDSGSDLHRHLSCYLQSQHDFVTENLRRKREIAHYLDLLCFASFVAQFLVTLRQKKKIISFAGLPEGKTGKALHTSREVPPVLPSETSRWSPFTASDSHCSLHGGVTFHLPQLTALPPDAEFAKVYKELKSSGSLEKRRDLATCEVGGRSYYVLEVAIENYYQRSPKLPRWVHSMAAELRSQCARLPSLNPRILELLRRSCGSREAAGMQTVPAQLLAAIKKGLLPLVALLIKRCTKTHLNKLDESGRGLVHYAAAHCHSEVLSLLLLAGSPVEQEVEGTATRPIHLASQAGGLDTVCCLLHFRANVLAVDGSGWAPVHLSASLNYHRVVVHLCSVEEQCVDLKTEDRAASTPLLLAAKNGGFDTVQSLVELGADLAARDSSGRGIVTLAALHHHTNILRYLINLARADTPVFQQLSEMLAAEAGLGYPEAGARSLDPLTQWRTAEHSVALLAHSAAPALVELLKRKSDDKAQHLSVQVMANVSSESAVRSALVEAGAVPALVALLSSSSERVLACTTLVLSDLAIAPESQASIVQAGAVPHLVKLLGSEADDVQLFAAACLGGLAYDCPSNKTAIAAASALEALKPLLSSDLSCIQASASSAVRAVVEENRACQLQSLSANLLPPLVHLLRSKEVSVHTEAALALEAVAENCQEAQQELLGHSTCISLLKRLLRMRSSGVKVAGGRALWAIAGHLISNQRLIAAHMGLNLLVSMLTIHNEKLDFVCSEALGALASELGENQRKILEVGGIKPLIEVLTLPTSQRVCLSVISTLSKLIVRPALRPNRQLQREVVKSRGLPVLAGLVCSQQATELVRVSSACTLAMLCLESPENVAFLRTNTEFSVDKVFEFLSSSDPTVQIRAGQSVATLAFNNPPQLAEMSQHHSIPLAFFLSLLESGDESLQCCAGFQLVVLCKLVTGAGDAEAAVKGIRALVHLLFSETEATQVLSASFLACLAHSSPGIPEAAVMAGALDPLIRNLTSGSGPVIESCCVALGYFSFQAMAARLMMGMFRDQPEKFEVFCEYSSSITVSREFLRDWQYTERAGLPVLSLESRGGPPATEGWKIHPLTSSRVRGTRELGRAKVTSLADPSTLTQGTEFKSHSTLQKGSVAETITAGLPRPAQLTTPTEIPPPTARGLLTSRKVELERKRMGSKGHHHGITKSTNIQNTPTEGAHT